jgi:hypothetical protein
MHLKSTVISNSRFLYKKTNCFSESWNILLAEVDSFVNYSNSLIFLSPSFFFHVESPFSSQKFKGEVWVGREVTGHSFLPEDFYFLDIEKGEAIVVNAPGPERIVDFDSIDQEAWSSMSDKSQKKVFACRVKMTPWRKDIEMEIDLKPEIQYFLEQV